MDAFGKNLTRRAKELGISNAEAARVIGLSERRFGNYVLGIREPDLATLLRISAGLKTTPNQLLGVKQGEPSPTGAKKRQLMDRLNFAAEQLVDRDLEFVIVQIEAAARFKS